MKHEKLFRTVLCIFIIITSAILCPLNAFAVDGDVPPDGNGEMTETYAEETEAPVQTEPETEAPFESYAETEAYTEPETEYVTEETEAETETAEAETAALEEETQAQTNAWFAKIDDATVNPTQLSTSMVSTKIYETNYFAGIVSWVCVIVGVIVIVTVLISTRRQDASHS